MHHQRFLKVTRSSKRWQQPNSDVKFNCIVGFCIQHTLKYLINVHVACRVAKICYLVPARLLGIPVNTKRAEWNLLFSTCTFIRSCTFIKSTSKYPSAPLRSKMTNLILKSFHYLHYLNITFCIVLPLIDVKDSGKMANQRHEGQSKGHKINFIRIWWCI